MRTVSGERACTMGGLCDRLMQCGVDAPRSRCALRTAADSLLAGLPLQLAATSWQLSSRQQPPLRSESTRAGAASALRSAAAKQPTPGSFDGIFICCQRTQPTPGRPATRPTQTTPGSAGPRGRSGLPGVGRPPGRSRLPRGHAQDARLTEADYPGVGQPHSQLPAPGYSGQPHFPLALCRLDREN